MESLASVQARLFEELTGSYKFVTNRVNLMTIMDSGYVDVASRSWRYAPDSRELYDGALPLAHGPLPPEILSLWESDDSNFPVILEFDENLVSWFPRLEGVDALEEIHLLVIDDIIPLNFLKKVVFRSSEEHEDYVLKCLSEKPFGQEFFVVEDKQLPTIDDHEVPKFFIDSFSSPLIHKKIGSILNMLKFYEPAGGHVDLFIDLVESVISGLENIDSCSSGGVIQSLVHDDKSRMEVASDAWLISQIYRYCLNTKGSEEFTQDGFVGFISTALREESEEVQNNVGEWLSYVSKIFDSEIDVPQLPDGGSIVKRAALLFAIRPSLVRFEKLAGSNLKPGQLVKLVASCFLGGLIGHQASFSPLLSSSRTYFNFVSSMLKRLLDFSNNPLLEKRITKIADMTSVGELVFDDNVIFTWEVEPDPVLFDVYNHVLSEGISVEVSGSGSSLIISFGSSAGEEDVVFVSCFIDEVLGEVCVRFTTLFSLLKIKRKELIKSHYYEILRANSMLGAGARFSIDEEMKAVVFTLDVPYSSIMNKSVRSPVEYVKSTSSYFYDKVIKDRFD